MKLQFQIEYGTNWGENLRVVLEVMIQGGNQPKQLIPLTTDDGRHWHGEVHVRLRQMKAFSYHYEVCRDGEVVRQEWNAVPRTYRADEDRCFLLPDTWKDLPEASWLYSSAFVNCINPKVEVSEEGQSYFQRTILLKVQAPGLTKGMGVGVLGNQPVLGNWNEQRILPLTETAMNEWSVTLSADGMTLPLEYKYVVYDTRTGELVAWEEGENRQCHIEALEVGQILVQNGMLRHKAEPWKGAGVVVPVFSLRSEKSMGVGDFGDLKRMVDWLAVNGLKVFQILPINDTTSSKMWYDSYPYSGISIYAFHPQYVDLNKLGKMRDERKEADFRTRQKALNALPAVDYDAVNETKLEYLQAMFDQDGQKLLASKDFKVFLKDNRAWLEPYAAFCVLRDRFGTADFARWPEYSIYNPKEIEKLCAPDGENYLEVAFHYYVQYHLHRQLLEVSTYARQKGVILKGDIPIGISRQSVEAWTEPHLFNMDGSAGAPPDDFAADGQNWGFPTYNWEVMRRDGYRWWVNRFRHMAQYFDAYRIDHVLGFFRIWEIPITAQSGLMGHFSPALPLTEEEIEVYGLKLNKEHFMRKNTKEVLFIEDPKEGGKYHPRIAAQKTRLYAQITETERKAFDVLYEDFYFHRHNQFWYEEAMKKLPVLTQATDMLVCAEDLGMVPECVGWAMNDLRILTLEIQTMPKGFQGEFAHLENNPYRSVATMFTHDMPTLRQWWGEDAERSQRYYNQILQKDGKAPEELPGWLCEEVVARHLFSPSMLCLLSLQDWLSMDDKLRRGDVEAERINVPANPENNWNYRMHLTIEKLMKAKDFNARIQELISRSGR